MINKALSLSLSIFFFTKKKNVKFLLKARFSGEKMEQESLKKGSMNDKVFAKAR